LASEDYCDLDGHLRLADDPCTGIARSGSWIELPDSPGLCVAPRSRLAKSRVARSVPQCLKRVAST